MPPSTYRARRNPIFATMRQIEFPRIVIERFDVQGEKTSWSYIEISAMDAVQIHDTDKKSFRGRGTINGFPFEQVALMPMGEGRYILPLNAALRKAIGKKPGDFVHLILQKDESEWQMNADLKTCLLDSASLYDAFVAMPKAHQRYFSNWIEGTKNPSTRADRIYKTLYAVEHQMDYAQMIRHFKNQPK